MLQSIVVRAALPTSRQKCVLYLVSNTNYTAGLVFQLLSYLLSSNSAGSITQMMCFPTKVGIPNIPLLKTFIVNVGKYGATVNCYKKELGKNVLAGKL